LTAKQPGDEPPKGHLDPATRSLRWKRTAVLVPMLVILFFTAVVERGHPAIGKGSRTAALVAALMDPLSLIADRSPGERGAGALLSTKLAKAGPEERVLSNVRDRPPAAGDADSGMLPPGNDLFAPAPGSDVLGSNGGPSGGGIPGGGGEGPAGLGPPGFAPFGAPFAGPEGEIIPGRAPFVSPPTVPIASAVPEPGAWAVMILGFFAVGAALRRRGRKQAGLSHFP
jgi:hypothetical protein